MRPAPRLPYPRWGGMINLRFVPIRMPTTHSSQPLMTRPAPNRKENGSPRSTELSEFRSIFQPPRIMDERGFSHVSLPAIARDQVHVLQPGKRLDGFGVGSKHRSRPLQKKHSTHHNDPYPCFEAWPCVFVPFVWLMVSLCCSPVGRISPSTTLRTGVA